MTPGRIGGRPETPLDWIVYLEGKLNSQRAAGRKYLDYYDSENKALQYAQAKFSEIFGGMFTGWRDNFCPLIVDSISERLRVQGFRMGPDEPADKDATEIWQRSFMDAESNATHIDALVQGTSSVIVWGDKDDNPTITPESANEVVVQYKPGSRRLLEAALKKYDDDWGGEYVTLWTEKTIFTSERRADGQKWSEPKSVSNPLKMVPVVPLNNRTRLRMEPHSELAAIIPIQDAINKVAADAIVASEFAAFPQRILSGVEPLPEDATDTEVAQARQEAIKAYIDRILTLDNPDARWGQFEAADLGNYVQLIDMLVQHMASQSRVPFHYFLLNGNAAPSGEAITAAEAGLVAKAKERMLHFGESWETAMRLAFLIKGDKAKAEAWSAEVIWDDPEYRSKASLADSLLKMKELGVPEAQLQEEYGYTPPQIQRFRRMREEEMKEAKRLHEQYGIEPALEPGQAQPGKSPARGEAKPKSARDKNASVELEKSSSRAA